MRRYPARIYLKYELQSSQFRTQCKVARKYFQDIKQVCIDFPEV
jgi:hypothetical protein